MTPATGRPLRRHFWSRGNPRLAEFPDSPAHVEEKINSSSIAGEVRTVCRSVPEFLFGTEAGSLRDGTALKNLPSPESGRFRSRVGVQQDSDLCQRFRFCSETSRRFCFERN